MPQEIEVSFTLKTGEKVQYNTEINRGYEDYQIRNFLRSEAFEKFPTMILSSFAFREEADIYGTE